MNFPPKKLRTGEIALQDDFQRQFEKGLHTQKVLLWNRDHANLKLDSHTNRVRSSIVMGDLLKTADTSYGCERKDIWVNIKGLVSSIEEVNQKSFAAWLNKYPEVSLSTKDLAVLCASHLADLFEQTQFGEKTALWRMMLAFGEKYVWEQLAANFNLSKDPRFLLACAILGAPAHAEPLHYTVCWTSQHNNNSFLDLRPAWLDEKVGDLNETCANAATKLLQNNPSNNHFCIREFPLGESTQEYPDFLMFVNGLPIVYVEMKTPEAGLAKALEDFQIKPNYQGAPLCVASNGQQIILTQDVQGKQESWVSYSGNVSSATYWTEHIKPLHAQQYFVEQILSQPKRLEFLIRQCASADHNGKMKIPRAQQYQALARFAQDMQWMEVCNSVLEQHHKKPLAFDNRLIRQTQRTGKTHTMIRAIHLALDKHPNLFRLSLLMVGEVQILGQIFNEMKRNISLGDRFLNVERAESRSRLEQMLTQEANAKAYTNGKVILANMQKISAGDIASLHVSDSHKALVVLDEGHLAQTGLTSDIRDMVLPNAVHLLLTATPKTTMNDHYNISKDWHVLDDFGFGLAKDSNMVCPVVFKHYNYSFNDDAEKLGSLVEQLKSPLGLSQDNSNDDSAQDTKMSRDVARAVRRQLEQDIIEERLNAITHELQEYENGLELRADGTRIFRPRALAFDRDTQNAIAMIQFIQDRNKQLGAKDLNMYQGRRFGIDVSDFGKDPNGGADRTFQSLNPGVVDQHDIETRLESMDPDLCIDVLLAVGKYTKGYDNNQLAVVALLRNIAEPSLMNQIYTRPATKREGKAKGVCLDLSIGHDNQACWKESLKLYDKKVDLNNLLEKENVDQLVRDVKHGLEQTARTLNITLDTLAKPNEVIRVLEQLSEDAKKDKARNFVLQARSVTALISNMPDSSIFGDVRAPLIGLQCTLRNLQSMYPDLVDDTSVDDEGVIDIGYSAQKLGDIIRQALNILGQSSLKALLDVRIHQGETFDADDSVEALQAVKELKIKNASQKTISALEAVTGKHNTKHASTVLLEAVNRVFDRLRYDNQSVEQREQVLQDAQQILTQVMEHEYALGMPNTVRDLLEQTLWKKASLIPTSLEHVGLNEGGILNNVVDVAASDMAENFHAWFSGLNAQWVEQSPEHLSNAWRQQYAPSSLADFISCTSNRTDLHQLSAHEWIEQFRQVSDRDSIRVLLNEQPVGADVLEEHGSLMASVMLMALKKRRVIEEAISWCNSVKDVP